MIKKKQKKPKINYKYMNELYYYTSIIILCMLYYYVFKKYKDIKILTHYNNEPFYIFKKEEINYFQL